MSHDTIAHRVVRPAMRLLAPTRVRPDHLTALRFLTGVTAAWLFATGRLGVGSVVFLVSAFLDRADGELARQTNRFSQHGHRYDLLADWAAGALCFLGLGFGARGGWLGLAAPLLGVLAAAGTTVLFWAINARQQTLPRYASGGRVLVDPDDGMFLLPPLLWLFGAPGVLLPAGIVTPILATLLLLRSARVPAKP